MVLTALILSGGLLAQTHNVTFQVDMTQYTGTFTTANVNGIFNGWCGGCNALADPDNDSIWTATIALPAGQTEFKFTVDGWTDQENFVGGEPCTVTNGGFTNRSLNITGDTILPVLCWNSCAACPGFTPSHNVTFQVDMTAYTGTFTDANVNGIFNGWCGACNPLTDPDNDNIWTGTVQIPSGTTEFKFTVDGWTDQENFVGGEPCTVTNGGFTNRSLTINGDTTLPVVCWNSCTPCGVQPTMANVTFQVDMNNYGNPFSIAQVNGLFNGWCGACDSLSDPDMDGIWTGVVSIPTGPTEFKFTVDGWTDQENFAGGEPCTVTTGGFTNRSITVNGDTTLPVVCWASCDPCMGTSVPVNVTFRVDLSNEKVCTPPDSVHVAGSFNGWPSPGMKLADPDNDDIYEVTMSLMSNTFYEYKFQNMNGGSAKWEGVANRTFTIGGTNDTTLALVCFDQTGPCGPPPPAAANVTFSVDMNSEVPGDTIWLIGSFTDPQWQDGRVPMTLSSTTGVFETTQNICPETFQYKYVNGDPSVTSNEEFDGDTAVPCAVPNGLGGWNREVTRMSSNDTILPTYIFSSCDISTVSVEELRAGVNFRVFPNPMKDEAIIEFEEYGDYEISMFDISGKVVLQPTRVNSDRYTLSGTNFESGVYFLEVRKADGEASYTRLIVE